MEKKNNQGEPVTWFRDGDEGREYCEKPFTTDWSPLYTHADPGEVERLRADVETMRRKNNEYWHETETLRAQLAELEKHRIRLRDNNVEALKENMALQQKLAERDALLREVHAGMWPSNPLTIRIGNALSASAEPSAPEDWCSTMERPKSQCGCPDCGSSIVQIGEPSAPVERDERAAFDAWTVRQGRVVGYLGWREDFAIWQAALEHKS